MHYPHCQELQNLTDFLNLKLSDDSAAGPTPQATKFIDAHGGPLEELVEAQEEIAHIIRCLQPEVFENDYPRRQRLSPEHAEMDEFSRKFNEQQRALIADFQADPGRFLGRLVDLLNQAERGARWIDQPAPPARTYNLSIAGKRWLLKKYPNGGRGTVFHWVAMILENDDLSKLGCCHVCKRFFVRAREWQSYCGGKCRIKNDNWQSAFRKAQAKAKARKVTKAAQAEKQRREKEAKDKESLLAYLNSTGVEGFNRRLPGGASQRAAKQKLLIEQLTKSTTVEAFVQARDSGTKRILHLHWVRVCPRLKRI